MTRTGKLAQLPAAVTLVLTPQEALALWTIVCNVGVQGEDGLAMKRTLLRKLDTAMPAAQ